MFEDGAERFALTLVQRFERVGGRVEVGAAGCGVGVRHRLQDAAVQFWDGEAPGPGSVVVVPQGQAGLGSGHCFASAQQGVLVGVDLGFGFELVGDPTAPGGQVGGGVVGGVTDQGLLAPGALFGCGVGRQVGQGATDDGGVPVADGPVGGGLLGHGGLGRGLGIIEFTLGRTVVVAEVAGNVLGGGATGTGPLDRAYCCTHMRGQAGLQSPQRGRSFARLSMGLTGVVRQRDRIELNVDPRQPVSERGLGDELCGHRPPAGV